MDNVQSGGLGVFGVLTVVFVTLKLLGLLSWSWLWVLSPLWLPIVVAFVIAMVFLFLATL